MSESKMGAVPALSSGYLVSEEYPGLHLPTCLLTAVFLHLGWKRVCIRKFI